MKEGCLAYFVVRGEGACFPGPVRTKLRGAMLYRLHNTQLGNPTETYLFLYKRQKLLSPSFSHLTAYYYPGRSIRHCLPQPSNNPNHCYFTVALISISRPTLPVSPTLLYKWLLWYLKL
jgi:hypothetical protein